MERKIEPKRERLIVRMSDCRRLNGNSDRNTFKEGYSVGALFVRVSE